MQASHRNGLSPLAGDYSQRFKDIVRVAFGYKGLLNFTVAQKAALRGSSDFLGLNFYSSQCASAAALT
jgi:beta-glucosidase/6-phospho-beta-glucosidase/beta-galactosidase